MVRSVVTRSSGVRVTLDATAQTHSKDSSELAFRTAGRLGAAEALRASVMGGAGTGGRGTVTVADDAGRRGAG